MQLKLPVVETAIPLQTIQTLVVIVINKKIAITDLCATLNTNSDII